MVKIPHRGKAAFLKSSDVENDDIVLVTDTPYIESAENSKFDKERTIVPVQVKRTSAVLRWSLNTTTNDRCVDKFGEDSALWVGKEIKIQKRMENVRGQDKPVLYGLPQTSILQKQLED
jgi:hypothetical protein